MLTEIGTKKIRVLLVDDQDIIGESVRRMVAGQEDIIYHFCKDPTQAIRMAEEVKPTVILQDLVMPEIDGLTLVRYFRANAATKDIPMIVLSSKEEPVTKAEAFECGANDYLVKLPDKVEFLARVRYHSDAYLRLLERNEAYQQLATTQKQVQEDLDQAAAYMQSFLPMPETGPVSTSWAYIPSSSLGGDAFGYHWIDSDHFVLYLLDVCGHGVGSALLSMTVMNVITTSLLKADLRKPAEVLKALNKAFPMEDHGGRFFTMWYGVYEKSTQTLTYSTAGHPPALLRQPGEAIEELKTEGFIIGGLPDSEFEQASKRIAPGSTLYVYSDGVFELDTPQGVVRSLPEFVRDLDEANDPLSVDAILCRAQSISQRKTFKDDFTIVRVAFQ